MTEHHIEIRKVADVKDMKAFIAVPWLIYRDDPNWVPPLKIERKQAFSEKNPFFEHPHSTLLRRYKNKASN